MADLLFNPKARFDYEILETLEAGIELKGYEVKSLRLKKGSIIGSRVIIRAGEAYIVGMTIPPYQRNNVPKDYEEQKDRKLLLRKKEIEWLAVKSKGLTIIPLRVYAKGKRLKMEIGLARTKKKFDKRKTIREREEKRKMERALRE